MIINELGKINGNKVLEYEFGNDILKVSIVNFGACVRKIIFNNKDVVLGLKNGEDYINNSAYIGANVGRVANRIENAKFTLNDIEYHLSKNEGNNNHHGGINGFHLKFYDVEVLTNGVKMKYISSDLEEGFPGTLTEYVTYKVIDNSLIVEFEASSTKDTLWGPTTHIYFNLNGEEVGNAITNKLIINADSYTPSNSNNIPTGEIASVINTPLDFRKEKVIEKDLNIIKGYDHNFILKDEYACSLIGDKTNIRVDLYTDLPCIQFYSGVFSMGGIEGKSKKYYDKEGIALEPQYAPNAINIPNFISPILRKDEVKKHYIKYSFSK